MKLLNRFLSSIIKTGELVVVDAEGRRHLFGDGTTPRAVMKLRDPALYNNMVFKTEMAVGEGYMDGTLTMEEGTSLVDLLTLYNMNRRSVGENRLVKALSNLSRKMRRFQQSNKVGEAQQNVAHHYDISNDFYKLFLDKNMLYSCAYFRNEDDSLETAQRNKLRLLAAKLDLKKGHRVLDIGCGWGEMALYLARLEEVDVTGVTLSREQYELANQRAEKSGFGGQGSLRVDGLPQS